VVKGCLEEPYRIPINPTIRAMTVCLSLNAMKFGRCPAGVGIPAARAKVMNDGALPGAPWSG
jgi:hypothetical protein